MGFIDAEAKSASRKLAEERGAFPNFEGSIYDTPEGAPDPQRDRHDDRADRHAVDHRQLLVGHRAAVRGLATCARSWTTTASSRSTRCSRRSRSSAASTAASSCSSSPTTARCAGIDEVPDDVQRAFVTAHDIAPEWHIRMQAAFQKHTDNAVSKTVNFGNEATAEDVRERLRPGLRARRQGRHDLPRRQQGGPGAHDGQERLRPERRRGGARRVRARSSRARGRRSPSGRTEKIQTGCGNLYVTVNWDEHGLCEVFTQMGKSGGCAASQSEALSRHDLGVAARRRRSRGDHQAPARHPLPVSVLGRGRQGALVRRRGRHRAWSTALEFIETGEADARRQQAHRRAGQPRRARARSAAARSSTRAAARCAARAATASARSRRRA